MTCKAVFFGILSSARALFALRRYTWLPTIIVLLWTGCHNGTALRQEVREWMKENGRIKVLCTTSFVGDLARAVGGELVDVLVLVPSQSDPHSYQLVKGDNEKFCRADLVLGSGLGLERGTSLVRYLGAYHAVYVGEGIARTTGQALTSNAIVDPHIWMDASLWAFGARVVAGALASLRPESAVYFDQRSEAVFHALSLLHKAIRDEIMAIPPEMRYLVTTHDAFRYFCRAYMATDEERLSGLWQTRCLAPEGLSPESQISTYELSMVVDFIVQHRISKVFAESGVNQDSIQKILDVCRERGRAVSLSSDCLYSDSAGPGMTYVTMMQHNARVISTGLTKGLAYDTKTTIRP